MGFKSDIEIAQETPMLHIREIAKTAGVDEKYLEQYGNYKAKVDYNILKDMADKPNGKLVYFNRRELCEWAMRNQVQTTGQTTRTKKEAL